MPTHHTKGLTRPFLRLFLPLAILLGTIGTLMALQHNRSDIDTYILNQQHNLDIVSHNLVHDMDQIIADVRLLQQGPMLQKYLNAPTQNHLKILEKSLLGLSRTKSIYSNISLLDDSGMEICRITRDSDGVSSAVGAKNLQHKGHRYYFSEVRTLHKNDIYVSPLDLTMNLGVIERPFQPTIRFAAPLFDNKGLRKGALVVYYRASILLNHLAQILGRSQGEPLFLNDEGYYMLAPDPQDEWGFMLGKENSFSQSNPEAWRSMQERNQGYFTDKGQFYVFSALYPRWYVSKIIGGVDNLYRMEPPPATFASTRWLIATRLSSTQRNILFYHHGQLIALLSFILLVIAASGCLLIVRVRISRHAEELKMAAITNSAHDAIIMLDDQGIITFWNPAATEIFGYSSPQAVGQPLSALLVPDRHLADFKKYFSAFINTKQNKYAGQTMTATGLRQNGEEFPLEFSVAAVHINEEWQAVALVRDITVKQKVMAALEDAKEKAEQANRAKSEFVANMSHEIRTPMNAILGLSDLALDIDMEPRLRDYFKKINSAGQSLMKILNNVLDFSKIEAGKLTITPRDFHFHDLLQGLATLFAGSSWEKNIEFLIHADPSIPLMLRGDDLRLHQILVNLIGNSFKFTDDGEIYLSVSMVESTDSLMYLKFAVQDSGIGIDQEKISFVFEAFTQADSSTTRKYGGTGLGLNICQQLVHLLGGNIEVESSPGLGSTFYFTIPLERCEGDEQHLKIAGNPHILLMVENKNLNTLLEDMLTSFGCRVISTNDTQLAMKLLADHNEENAFNLAIIDYFLTEKNGPATCAALKKTTTARNIPILMVTGLDQQPARKAADQVVDGFLSKPITPAALCQAIDELLNKTSGQERTPNDDETPSQEAIAKIAGARILLAEDSEVNQQVAREMLERVNIVVESAATGLEVLKKYQEQHFDGVLMDIQMPEMDGYEAARALRKAEGGTGHIPIIAMTAHAFENNRRQCLAAGMDDFISKPVRPDELYLTLAKWICGDGKIHTFVHTNREDIKVAHETVVGLDLDEMLSRVGNKQDLLVRLFQIFQEKYCHFDQEILTNLGQHDYSAVKKQAHTIKGVAATICANRLQEAALDLEKKVTNSENPAAEMLVFSSALKEVVTSIDALLDQWNENPKNNN
ncbi:MAG: response regulator [Proteobacteria bacterium]|nr:response regulator [Pseudomonadota bacterium]MBU1641368.1 response regulator [Pseudomonadota bacterium]